jgi:hypothetical protein
MVGPLAGADGYLRASTINAANIDVGPPGLLGVQSPYMIRKCDVTYMCSIDKSNSAHFILLVLSSVMSYYP